MLPQGFTRVEYIESTGNQYINTKVVPNVNTRVVLDIEVLSYSGNDFVALFGERHTTQTTNLFSFWIKNATTFRSDFGDGSGNKDIVANPVGRYVIDKNKNVTSVRGVTATNPASTISTTYPIYLLSNNYGGTADARRPIARAFSSQIYSGDSLTRDYIPCIDENSDANLWDDVNGMLAEKVGTFLYGSPVVPDKLTNLAIINAQNGMAFSWAPSENANEYKIARDGVQIASVYGDVTSYTDTGAIGEHTYTVTPYNGTQAGTGASITIFTKLDTPVNLKASLDDRAVTLTWDAVSGAEGYKVYRDGAVVASVASTTYTDTLTPPASVAYAVSAYAGTIQSEISQTVVVENWEGVLLTLITDRTAADVAEAKRLRDKLLAGDELTEEESARYFAGLRGAYNANDMNRVGAAVRYVANRLNAEGYGAYVSPKTDWQMEDVVRQSDWNKYLDEVRHLRAKLTLMRTTPQITDGMYSGLKSYAEANAIEQILVDLDWMLTNIIRNYIYAGEVFGGEV